MSTHANEHWLGFPASRLVDYPLPRHAQAPPVSSYSSLSHAIDPGYTIYDASMARSAQSSYPYPTASSTGTGPTRTPRNAASSANIAKLYGAPRPTSPGGPVRTRTRRNSYSNGSRGPTYGIQTQATNVPRAPTHLTRLPQPKSAEGGTYHGEARLPYVTFQCTDSVDLGVIVGDMVLSKYNPDIVGAQDRVLVAGDRYIKVRILWPGYSRDPFQKNVRTHNCEITRELLLLLVAKAVTEFTDRIKKDRISVERGYERWAIGRRPDGSKGINGSEVVVTGLKNRQGASWQPELYVPL